MEAAVGAAAGTCSHTRSVSLHSKATTVLTVCQALAFCSCRSRRGAHFHRVRERNQFSPNPPLDGSSTRAVTTRHSPFSAKLAGSTRSPTLCKLSSCAADCVSSASLGLMPIQRDSLPVPLREGVPGSAVPSVPGDYNLDAFSAQIWQILPLVQERHPWVSELAYEQGCATTRPAELASAETAAVLFRRIMVGVMTMFFQVSMAAAGPYLSR